MKYFLISFLFCLFANHAQADGDYMCHALEGSDLNKHIDHDKNKIPDLDSRIQTQTSFAVSDDQRLIALYQVSNSKEQALFRLFDSQTGKLLQRQTLENYEERSGQTTLRFSPQNRFVYLEGMSYNKSVQHSFGAIPFWNLAKNQIMFSPCITAMGVRNVQFSDDQAVAYATTTDSLHSLCSTTEAKSLVHIPGYFSGAEDFIFDPTKKHLYAKSAFSDYKSHQILLKSLGQNNPHVTLYKSPVPEDKFNPKTNDTFAARLIGPPSKRRLLVAKSRGDHLDLSLWDYTGKQAAPGKVYQHEHVIPELNPDKRAVAYQRLRTSSDGKKAILLSRSGVIIGFDVATGRLLWKKQLPSRTTKRGYYNYQIDFNPLQAIQGVPIPPLVIYQSEPQAALLFDWQTGQQRQFDIPKGYLLSYKQYDAYLVFEDNAGDRNELLLINWQTGRRQVVGRPVEFRYTWRFGRLPKSQQLVFKPADLELKPPHSLFLLDLPTGKHRVLTTPYPDHRFYDYDDTLFAANGGSSNYVRLTHGYHSIRRGKQLNTENKMQESFELYDMSNSHSQILQMADFFLYSKLVKPANKPPEYHTISYDMQDGHAKYCRLKLQHAH